MTTVIIHGILGKIFGNNIKINIGSQKNILNAIDSVKSGFRKTLLDLHNNGQDYFLTKIDNCFHFLPSIIGQGKVFGYIIAAVLIVVGVILTVTGNPEIGVSMILAGLQMTYQLATLKLPKPKIQGGSTGGQVGNIDATNKTFNFGNQNNLTTQGSLLPIGYGRVRIGSNVIMTSVKNYPTSIKFENQVKNLITNININD